MCNGQGVRDLVPFWDAHNNKCLDVGYPTTALQWLVSRVNASTVLPPYPVRGNFSRGGWGGVWTDTWSELRVNNLSKIIERATEKLKMRSKKETARYAANKSVLSKFSSVGKQKWFPPHEWNRQRLLEKGTFGAASGVRKVEITPMIRAFYEGRKPE